MMGGYAVQKLFEGDPMTWALFIFLTVVICIVCRMGKDTMRDTTDD